LSSFINYKYVNIKEHYKGGKCMALGTYPFRGYGNAYGGNGPRNGPIGYYGTGSLGAFGGSFGLAFGGLGAVGGLVGAAFGLRGAGFGLGVRPPFFY
jgi:hypothetical protein